MKVTFLGQGFNPVTDGSVGNKLMEFFSENSYQTFTGISAFASEAGINGLSNCISISHSFQKLNLIVGIDQQGTSKEALEEILNLGINSYIFYQSEAPIFHPKIYLFEGEEKTSLIIGSSNLTARGLFNNVESSILIEFVKGDMDGDDLLSNVKRYYSTLFDFTDPNLFKITRDAIDSFVKLGIIPSKRIWLERQGKKKANGLIENQDLEIPRRDIAKLPRSFAAKPTTKQLVQNFVEETTAIGDPISIAESVLVSTTAVDNMVEVWKSKPLTERDLNIPSGSTTNATGSMSLSKGLLENIDQRHYFRENVFNTLSWSNSTRRGSEHLEKANARFKIKIDGEDKGEFSLTITHNPKTDSETYLQNNSVTNLSWGTAKDLIKKRELLGKTLTLIKETTSEDQYTLAIE